MPFTLQAQFELEEDYSFKPDKAKHAIYGFASSATIFYFVYKSTKDEELAKRAGIIGTVTVGMLKEIADHLQGGEISIADLLYTSGFAISTSIGLEQFVKHRKRKRKYRDSKHNTVWSLDNEFINKQK